MHLKATLGLTPRAHVARVQALCALIPSPVSLLRSSSLDLIYHHYRLREPSESLRGARVKFVLDGQHRDLGDAVHLVFVLGDDPRVQPALCDSAFRPGTELATDRYDWIYAGFLALRVAFRALGRSCVAERL